MSRFHNQYHRECAAKRERYLSDKSLHAMTDREAAKIVGIHFNTISAWRRAAGIPRYRPPKTPVDKLAKARPRLPKIVVQTARILNAWPRPKGMQEHVQELRK